MPLLDCFMVGGEAKTDPARKTPRKVYKSRTEKERMFLRCVILLSV
jgi:hypothetical protein